MTDIDDNDLGWLKNQLRRAQRKADRAEQEGKKGQRGKHLAMVKRLQRIISRIEPYRSNHNVVR